MNTRSASVPELRTERLRLREWRDADLDPFAALCADPAVMEHFPALLSRDQAADLMARLRAHFAANGFGFWAVERPGLTDFIGFVGLSRIAWDAPFTPRVEIGWRLAAAHWGAGLATEAATAALDDGFGRLGLEEVVAFTVPANLRSQAVMGRLGMVRDAGGDFDHPRLPTGHRLRRHVLYRVRRADWTARRARAAGV